MAKTSTTHRETVQQFASSNLTPELSKQRAALLLNSEELLRDVQRLTSEDQTRFVDKVDKVCRLGTPL